MNEMGKVYESNFLTLTLDSSPSPFKAVGSKRTRIWCKWGCIFRNSMYECTISRIYTSSSS